SLREKAYRAMEAAFQEARRIENTVSEWRPESQTTLLNQNAGKGFVPIGQDLMTTLEKARDFSEMTDGAFDITFASKCTQKRGVLQSCPTYHDVTLLPELGLARISRGTRIGVSGIAKGYIVDRMSDVLKKAGFKKFLVNAGDLYAAGSWKIKIR